ncbi:GNAT family N-acetyltransferase [Psychrobacter sp. B38]|uniref:GNAT family N-acetyltransferase n=1 Tax=Psychrobacter sp. B38 TaxID=3143538 RepID=UPI003210E914
MDDSQQGIKRMLQRNPTLNFVAEDDDRIVGVIIAGEDGRRGYLYHTAVHQDYRYRSIGQGLVKSVLNEMKKLEITKVGLFIFQNNHFGNGFWENMGFNVREDLYYRDLALTELQRIDT